MISWIQHSAVVEHVTLPKLHTYKHRDNISGTVTTGTNIYLTIQYINPVTPLIQTYYWMNNSKHKSNTWTTRPTYKVAKERSTQIFIQLILSGIEQNPGPRRPRFPCTICQKACKTESISCDDCDQWTHRLCIGMLTREFSNLGKSDEAWTCPSCSKPNSSSTIIYNLSTGANRNTSINISTDPQLIDSIAEDSIPSTSGSSINSPSFDSNLSFNSTDRPFMTSSPKTQKSKSTPKKHLRILNINFQSLRKKGKQLETLIESTDPDIILGTETWLDPNIKNSEIIPDYYQYDVERRDRPNDPHGGVIIATKQHLQMSNTTKSKNIELVTGTICIEGNKKMLIGSFYRPPDKTDDTK